MKMSALIVFLVIGCLDTTAHSQTTLPATAASAPSASTEPALRGDLWRVLTSPYTLHYHSSPDHRNVFMLGVERQYVGGLMWGGSWFRNSFGQPSAYLYGGKRFDDFTSFEPLYAQVTGGVLYGYKPPFQDKVPYNHNGWSPGAVLSLGWQFTPMYAAQLNFLGNAAVMFQFSADFR